MNTETLLRRINMKYYKVSNKELILKLIDENKELRLENEILKDEIYDLEKEIKKLKGEATL